MKPRITKAPKKTSARPVAVKAPTAKSKLVSRPKPKTTPKPAPTAASTNGPLNQIPPESPTPPPAEFIEPVIQSKPLIITIPPESPAPPLASNEAMPPAMDATVPAGYIVVESDATPPALGESDRTVTATDEGTDPVAPQPTPSVPTVVIPAGQAMDEVSSFQIGDVIIIAVRVQPTLAPEVEP